MNYALCLSARAVCVVLALDSFKDFASVVMRTNLPKNQ